MALHIADPEVSRLVTELASLEKTSKTEALRRLLKKEVQARTVRENRLKFAQTAAQIIRESRAENQEPVTKQEMDELWGQ